MSDDLPEAIWEGSFRVFGVDVKCFVLSDGQRIIEHDSFHNLMPAMAGGSDDPGEMEEFLLWQQTEGTA